MIFSVQLGLLNKAHSGMSSQKTLIVSILGQSLAMIKAIRALKRDRRGASTRRELTRHVLEFIAIKAFTGGFGRVQGVS